MWKIILLCVLLFLLLLLSIKVSLSFWLENEEYQVSLKILFFKKKLFSSEDEEEEPASSNQAETVQKKKTSFAEEERKPPDIGQSKDFYERNNKQKGKQLSSPETKNTHQNESKQDKPSKEKQSILDKIQMILDFIRPLPEPFKKLIRRFHVTNLRIYIRVAEEDAAETAISYGRMWGIVSGCLAVCRNILKIELKSLRIEPDFWQQKPLTKISGQLNLRVYAALAFILRYLWLYLKQTIQKSQTEKGGVQNESTSNRGNVRHIHGKNQGND